MKERSPPRETCSPEHETTAAERREGSTRERIFGSLAISPSIFSERRDLKAFRIFRDVFVSSSADDEEDDVEEEAEDRGERRERVGEVDFLDKEEATSRSDLCGDRDLL